MSEEIDKIGTKKTRTRKLTPKRVADALRKNHGILVKVAKSLDVTRQGVQQYIARYPALQNIQAEAREVIVDLAEDGLIGGIQMGEQWAIGLALRTLGKNRGYVEKSPETPTEEQQPKVMRVGGQANPDLLGQGDAH